MAHPSPLTPSVRVYTSARAFLDRAEPWLVRREAEHNLLLGIAHRLTSEEVLPPDVLLATVEHAYDVVGCVFRTPPYKLGLTPMPDEAISAVADAVAARYDTLPAVLGPESVARRFAEEWSARAGVTATPGMRQRSFQARAVRGASEPPPGGMRVAAPNELGLIHDWIEAFAADAHVPLHADVIEQRVADGAFHLWDHDGPKALAAWSGRTPNGVRIGPVYTPPVWRGRGYGTALTAALTQKMLDGGRRFCFLYTDVGNPTSNAIYQRIGYEPVAEVMDVNFSNPDADRDA